MINKKVFFMLVLILVCALMTGCFRGEFRIDINKDGSGDLEYQVSAIPLLADQITEMKSNMQKDGFAVVDKQEGDWQGLQAKKHFEKADELRSLGLFSGAGIKNPTGSSAPSLDGLTIEHGWLQDVYSLNSNIDLNEYSTKKKSDLDESMVRMVMSQVQLKVIINLPVQPESHNANSVQNDGRHLEWNLRLGQNNQIQATAKVWNKGHIAITTILAIVLIGFIIFLWRQNQLSKTSEVTPVRKRTIISAIVVFSVTVTSIIGYHIYITNNTLAVSGGNLSAKSQDLKEAGETKASNGDKSNDTKPSESNANENLIVKAQRLLEQNKLQGQVIATSLGHNAKGFLSIIKNNGQHSFIIFDQGNNQIAQVSFTAKAYNLAANSTAKYTSPVVFTMTIFNDKHDQDEKLGSWNNENHIIPVYAAYKFDSNGNVVPGMLTSGQGTNPSHYQSYLNESKNVDIANLFLTEMKALQENAKQNQISIPTN